MCDELHRLTGQFGVDLYEVSLHCTDSIQQIGYHFYETGIVPRTQNLGGKTPKFNEKRRVSHATPVVVSWSPTGANFVSTFGSKSCTIGEQSSVELFLHHFSSLLITPLRWPNVVQQAIFNVYPLRVAFLDCYSRLWIARKYISNCIDFFDGSLRTSSRSGSNWTSWY